MEDRVRWRAILALIPLATLVGALLLFDPMAQPLAYHDFADRRPWVGIPNFADVASNVAFLVPGLLGLRLCLARHPAGARNAWTLFFAGLILVALGSAYYHWAPGNGTLVWDRGAMTVAFMGLYVALLAEYAGADLERPLLLPAVIVGTATVLFWHWMDDLRPYFALQGAVFASALVMVGAMESAHRQKGYIVGALGCYAGAIAFEQLDRMLFALSGGAIAGHAVKHVLAGLAGYWLYRMLRRRGVGEGEPP